MENREVNKFKEYFQPVIILVAICLVITFALAFVNGVTSPIIEQHELDNAEAARNELLPGSTFTQYDGDLYVYTPDKVFVTDCYVADNGGAVITVSTKSFGGVLIETIGIDSTGAITGVKVMSHADTKGLGTKAHDHDKYLYQFDGKVHDDLAFAANVKKDAAIAQVTGATISSNGVYQGVCCALEQFKEIGGAN